MSDLLDHDPLLACRQAEELLARDRVAQARLLLADALRSAPDHPDLLYLAARADWQGNEHARARDTLQRVLALSPDHFAAQVLLFELLAWDGELAQAEQVILPLLRAHPQDAGLWARYSRLMLQALHVDKARRLAQEALRLAPDHEPALRAQALCDLVTLRHGTDSAALQRMLAHNPEDLHTLMLVCVALQRSGKLRAALAVAQALLRAQPMNASLVNLVKHLRWRTHWTMLPLWPLQRYGWGASIGLWLAFVIGMRFVDRIAPPGVANGIGYVLLGYVVYSWVWPGLLKRWLDRR
jgi:tetratricopeptide (TPR) repeat protein